MDNSPPKQQPTNNFLDDNFLDKLSNPESPQAIKMKRFMEREGPQGWQKVYEAVNENHIDGTIGLAIMGAADFNELIDDLTDATIHILATDAKGTRILHSFNPETWLYVNIFTKVEHVISFLKKSPTTAGKYNNIIDCKMNDLFNMNGDTMFGLHINPGIKVFEVAIPPEFVNTIYNCLIYGFDEVNQRIVETGKIPPRRYKEILP